MNNIEYFMLLTLILGTLFIVWGGGRCKVDFMSLKFTNALKGFGILTVIWAHSGARLEIGGIQFIAGVGVALFLICSGYGLENSFDMHGLKGFWRKRVIRLCIPYWIVTSIGLLLTNDLGLKEFLERIIFIEAGWYIKYILICYVLFWVIKKLTIEYRLSQNVETIILFSVYTVWFTIDSIFLNDPEIPFLVARQMLCFPTGVYLAKYCVMKDKITNCLVAFFTCIVGVLFMAVTQLPYINALPVVISNLISLLTVFPLAISVMIIFDKISWLACNRFLLFAGTISYELFLIHGFTEQMITFSVSSICLSLMITYGAAICLHYILNWRIRNT